MIRITADNKQIPVKWIEFSDGALTCKVDSSIKESKNQITLAVDPSTPVKQINEEIRLVLSAFDQMGFYPYGSETDLNLFVPYLPYGRADRVFEEGNPLPLHEFLCNWEYAFDCITTVDIHNIESVKSPDGLEYYCEFYNVSQLEAFKYSVPYDFEMSVYDYVIAPDKGAVDKASEIANFLGAELVTASKERDISTGKIINTTLDVELPVGSSVIICDDILDGGGTFIPLAEKLRSQGCTVDLYITHLIAAKGLDIFKGLIDNIYFYHTVGNYINRTDVLNFNKYIKEVEKEDDHGVF